MTIQRPERTRLMHSATERAMAAFGALRHPRCT